MTCPDCAAKNLEIAELSRALDGAVWVRNDEAAKVARALGLSPQQGEVVYLLYKSAVPMTSRQLTEGLDPVDSVKERFDPDYASVVICHARKRLSADTILSRQGQAGYSLSSEVRARLAQVLT